MRTTFKPSLLTIVILIVIGYFAMYHFALVKENAKLKDQIATLQSEKYNRASYDELDKLLDDPLKGIEWTMEGIEYEPEY